MSDLQLESALRAARRGWRVFPVVKGGKRPLVCWQGEATCDASQLRSWWSGRWRRTNIGAVVPAGVVVVDVDPRHGGDGTLEELEDAHGALPRTLTAITGSGGQHLWFAVERPDDLRQGANVLGRGLDTRCAGRGFVIIPCSVHPCGGRYLWAHGDKSIAAAPDWLVDLLAKSSERQTLAAAPLGDACLEAVRYALAALCSEAAAVAAAPEGTRNDTLNRAAFRMRRFVVAGHLHVDRVIDALSRAAQLAGLDDDEICRTISSGIKAGAKR